MAKVNANYEVVYIMDPALGEEAIAAMIEKFKTLVETQGTVTAIDDWGKRRLAYPINYKTEGYYVLVNFESEATLPREIERTMQIAESILRYLIVKVEEKRSNVKPRPERKAPEVEEEIPAAEALEAAEEAPVAEPTEE